MSLDQKIKAGTKVAIRADGINLPGVWYAVAKVSEGWLLVQPSAMETYQSAGVISSRHTKPTLHQIGPICESLLVADPQFSS